MSNTFHIVTNVTEIAALNKELGARLSKTFKNMERREITFPSGHFTGSVYFERSSGTGVRAWAPGRTAGKLLNFLLVGEPKSQDWMEIEVQMNFPAGKYNRMMAGAFVMDEGGNVFLAHRGKLTKGRAGLPKNKVFREFASLTIMADDGPLTSKLILIGALRDKNLSNRLWDFAAEAREVATKIGHELHDNPGTTARLAAGTPPPGARNRRKNLQEQMVKLRGYFEEHAGEGIYKGHEGGMRTVEHGDIVRALERTVHRHGSTQKSQAIDLAVVADSKVDLFEVKTSSRSTDVYTGVGQLMIHGGTLSDLLKKKVERILVLPEKPKVAQERQIKRNGFRIVTFKKTGGSYKFFGL
jgi:hypothetical protein